MERLNLFSDLSLTNGYRSDSLEEMKSKELRKRIEPYGQVLVVVFVDSLIECHKSKKYKDILEGWSPSTTTQGYAVSFGGYHFIFLKTGVLNADTIAHESFHASDSILGRAGVEFFCDRNNESFAYMIGYITGLIHTAAKKYKIKIK